jgi:hypothetical protein
MGGPASMIPTSIWAKSLHFPNLSMETGGVMGGGERGGRRGPSRGCFQDQSRQEISQEESRKNQELLQCVAMER